jgi:hypothetical protein
VDDFPDRVHAELARLIEENNDLRHQVEQIDQQLRALPVDTGRTPGPPQSPAPVMTPLRPPIRQQTSPSADHDLQAATMLVVAQQMTDQVTDQARTEADGMLNRVWTLATVSSTHRRPPTNTSTGAGGPRRRRRTGCGLQSGQRRARPWWSGRVRKGHRDIAR